MGRGGMIRKDPLKKKEVGKNACLAGPTGLPPLQSAAMHGNIGDSSSLQPNGDVAQVHVYEQLQ